MITKHIVSPMVFVLLAAVALLAGCAQMQAGQGDQPVQLAARNCKVVPADFVGKPKKNPTAAERAEAELKMSRFAFERGGNRIDGTLNEIARDCN